MSSVWRRQGCDLTGGFQMTEAQAQIDARQKPVNHKLVQN